MLINNLYTIHDLTARDTNLQASLALNTGHPIFTGHFPGQPVLPGACMLQMIKELMETVMNTRLQLITARNIKFLMPVDPRITSEIQASLSWRIRDDRSVEVKASLTAGTTPCFQLAGQFQRAD